MPTIAEIIAARKAGAKNPATANAPHPDPDPKATAAKLSLAERMEMEEAINRIDAPGKRKGGSLVLNNAPEPKPLAEEVPAEPRMLGARVGEALTEIGANPPAEVLAWDAIQNSFSTDLVIMSDPEPGSEHAWIALKPSVGSKRPILIHKLPFWPHPERLHPPSEPF